MLGEISTKQTTAWVIRQAQTAVAQVFHRIRGGPRKASMPLQPEAQLPMVIPLTEADLQKIDGEMCIRAVRIGERVGMAKPRNVSQLIERNRPEFERYGPVHRRGALVERPQGGNGSLHTVNEYWLNRAQAVRVLTLLKTDIAEQAPPGMHQRPPQGPAGRRRR